MPVPPDKPTKGHPFRWIRNGFFAGVVVVTPIAATSWLVYTLVTVVDRSVGGLVSWISRITGYPVDTWYAAIDGPLTIPGIGVLIAFIVLTLLGLLARNIIGRWFIGLGEFIVDRLPFIRSIYGPIKQILETIFRDQGEAFQEVAMVEYPRKGTWALCFVTAPAQGEVREKLPTSRDGEDLGEHVGVFIPTTPNPTSGFLLFVPRKDLKILDMSVEDGARVIISAGIVTEKPNGNGKSKNVLQALADEVQARAGGKPDAPSPQSAALTAATPTEPAAQPEAEPAKKSDD